MFLFFFFNDTATTEIYTLSLHDALPISLCSSRWFRVGAFAGRRFGAGTFPARFRRGRRRAAAGIDLQAHPSGYARSEEHTSELQSPCNLVCRLLLEKKKKHIINNTTHLY